MTAMKYLLLVNPVSGTVSKKRIVPRLRKKMEKAGMDFDIVFTAASSRGFGSVLACGGDGTVNEIAAALAGSDTVFGIIPTGSGNGLARHLGIPVDPEMALKVIVENNIIRSGSICSKF